MEESQKKSLLRKLINLTDEEKINVIREKQKLFSPKLNDDDDKRMIKQLKLNNQSQYDYACLLMAIDYYRPAKTNQYIARVRKSKIKAETEKIKNNRNKIYLKIRALYSEINNYLESNMTWTEIADTLKKHHRTMFAKSKNLTASYVRRSYYNAREYYNKEIVNDFNNNQ